MDYLHFLRGSFTYLGGFDNGSAKKNMLFAGAGTSDTLAFGGALAFNENVAPSGAYWDNGSALY